VHQTVENGIGNGHIADDLVPMFRRQLGSLLSDQEVAQATISDRRARGSWS
jgi:hypothetical protein